MNNYDTPKILAANLRALMKARPDLSSNMKLEAASRGAVKKSTVQRVLKAEVACDLRTLANISRVFDLEPWQLLIQGFNPADPPVLRKPSDSEIAFYEKLQALIQEVKDKQ
jgi:hypothetical protein